MTTRASLFLWAITGFLTLVLLTQPISVEAQYYMGLSIIVALILTWKFARGDTGRQIFLGLASMVVIRYVFWRSTSTLPPLSDPIDFVLGFILLLAECYCVLILTISLIINVDPLKRKPLAREEDEKLPTVDVFIPTYNEDEEILATTMAAAMSMDYPAHKMTVWLLDDGGTDQKRNDSNPEKAAAARQRYEDLQVLCKKMGARYLTRQKNQHAKAGNMNNGLKNSTGDIIVVFDADHAPFRSFLRETVGHFLLDPKLFLVQTPHIFLNPDPIEKNLKTFDRMPSENEMFYSITQRGLDKWDASFFCGSAALLRRTALETTGGFSGITITEDCETAFELHGNGWHSVFVDKPLIAGLQPETFTSFIGQRSRWCQGMFQILILKNPALKKGLSLTQRVSYLSSMTFWFFPLPRLVFMFAPLLYIFLNTKIFVSNISETIAYTSMYIVVNVMLQNYLYGKVRWPWISELYEFVQGVFLVKAMVTVALNPRKPTFNVTAKGLTLDNNHLSELAWPFFAIWGLLFFADLVAVARYFLDSGVNNLIVVVGCWNTFNLMIAGAALGAVAERAQPDRHPRLPIDRTGFLLLDNKKIPVQFLDVSAGGCSMVSSWDMAPPEIGDKPIIADLAIKPIGNMLSKQSQQTVKVRLVHTGFKDGRAKISVAFHEMQPEQHYLLADLMYGDSGALERFLDKRRRHQNIYQGTKQFLTWGITEPVRAFRYLWIEHKAKALTDKAAQEMTALAAKVAEDSKLRAAALAELPSANGTAMAKVEAGMKKVAPAA
ncbi:MAG: UDP-forming cellulose synthase catalytic subunit [Hyphomicrobiales bacterium]|nr:UDP-forming cellulose synthase catalytic subunit [Hyphomicrobiales bacterium]MDE2116059.1 UDP-forming cellulose synthase catalytic subunit [Hyphomicrobiales bacterium]